MEFIKRHWEKIIFAISLACFISVLGFSMAESYATDMSIGLRHNVIRFHVLANSDTTEDQVLKLHVRDEVLKHMEPILKDSPSIKESRARILAHKEEIQKVAEDTILSSGKDYSVKVALTYEDFPTKSYGDIVLPAGKYEACRIIIGEGKGKNWWCVMFPPLCYVDAASGTVPREGKEELKKNLTEEQYKLVEHGDSSSYTLKFKLVELFHKDK
ncbi:MAG: stage II sporulation protein R [Cellulosilyticaceae bacterium]